MALFDDTQEDRTESPSQFRREEFRKQGTVAVSRELLSVGILLGVGAILLVACHLITKQFAILCQQFFNFEMLRSMTVEKWLELRMPAVGAMAWMVLPIFLVAVIVGIVVSVAQVGLHVTWQPIEPNWERINPIMGFQRLFSLGGFVEAFKAILKMAIISTIAWLLLRGQVESLGMMYQKSAGEQILYILQIMSRLFFISVSVLAILGALDYGYQRFQIEKQMRTTRREAKEEFKLREGDPLIKSRIRSIQRKIANNRMMESVPKSDVVVTNPTHLAIALQYDSKVQAAPKVVAKGAGVVAEKIRELARKSGIPIVENKPLARTLFKELDIGQMIPKELYKAVAEVLAYVYRLKTAAKLAMQMA